MLAWVCACACACVCGCVSVCYCVWRGTGVSRVFAGVLSVALWVATISKLLGARWRGGAQAAVRHQGRSN